MYSQACTYCVATCATAAAAAGGGEQQFGHRGDVTTIMSWLCVSQTHSSMSKTNNNNSVNNCLYKYICMLL